MKTLHRLLVPLASVLSTTTSFVVVTPPQGSLAGHPASQERSKAVRCSTNNKGDYEATASTTPKLGINIGSQLNPMNETELADLKADFARIIDKAVQDGMVDLQKLHDKMGRDIEDGAYVLEQAMYLNGVKEEKKFKERMNVLVGDFLNKTADSRERTHKMAWEAEEEEKRKERETEKKSKKAPTQSWGKTNDEWDAWDDW
jgi:hypothetical protein